MAGACRSNTVIDTPDFSTLPAMGLPMLPTPMNPTVAVISVLHVSASLCRE